MIMDRDLQKQMLLEMREAYPLFIHEFGGKSVDQHQMANLYYLTEHGLCETNLRQDQDEMWSWSGIRISAAGLDFLAEDGGLSAILSVVTIKFHVEMIRDLIAARIDSISATPEEKSALRKHLRSLSGVALQGVSVDLVKLGLDHLPNGLTLLGRLIGLL